jgi:Lon protease-like protein
LPPEPALTVPADCGYLVRLLQHALPQLAPVYDFTPVRYDDAAWVSSRLVEILPLPLEEKQHCLEMQDPLQRLAHLRMRVKVEAVEQEEDLQ